MRLHERLPRWIKIGKLTGFHRRSHFEIYEIMWSVQFNIEKVFMCQNRVLSEEKSGFSVYSFWELTRFHRCSHFKIYEILWSVQFNIEKVLMCQNRVLSEDKSGFSVCSFWECIMKVWHPSYITVPIRFSWCELAKPQLCHILWVFWTRKTL